MTKTKFFKKALHQELLITYIVDFLISFLLCKATFHTTILPLGVSYALARSKKGTSIYPILGAFLGYVFLPNSVIGFLYAGILLTSVALFNLTKVKPITILATTYILLGLISTASRGASIEILASTMITCVTCVTSFYIYEKINDDKFEEIAKLFLICTITMSTIELSFFGVSPAKIILVFTLLSIIYFIDASKSIITAVLFGSVCDILTQNQFYTLGFSFATLIVSASKFLNKMMFSAVFTTLFVLFGSLNGDMSILFITFIELVIASAIFVLLPKKYFKYFAKKRTVVNVKKMSTTGILQDISEILIDTERKKTNLEFSDMKNIFSMTENKVCKCCKNLSLCYGTNHKSTVDDINLTAMRITKSEVATIDDFPETFRSRCIDFSNYLNVVNNGVSLAILKNKTKAELYDQKQMMARQYKALADVLQNAEITFNEQYYPEIDSEIFEFLKKYHVLSKVVTYRNSSGLYFVDIVVLNADRLIKSKDEIAINIGVIIGKTMYFHNQIIENSHTRLVFKQKVPFVAKPTIKSQGKDEVSGDVASYFKTKDDMFYAIISDGMGSGVLANDESNSLVSILIKLLKTGSTPLKATKVIEPLSMLKSNGDSFVALDLIAINLITLETQFVKYGAFSSYVVKSDEVLKISCNNLALGIGSDAQMRRIRLQENDKIVMLSDGFSISDYEIEQILANSPDDICQELFDADPSKDDDKTVMVIDLNNLR